MAGSGSASGFDANAFRTNIRFVYNMAAPPAAEDQAVFYFPSQLVYTGPVDGDNVPFDPNDIATRVPPRAVRHIPCSIEYQDAQGQEIIFGTTTASRVAITVLDEEYAQVKGCSYVVIGGEKYLYKHTEAPSGLFDVGLWTMHFTAENDL